MGVEVFGMVAGLGFVLSFGYWCTDFLVVQRAMAADSHVGRAPHSGARGIPKMMMPFIVIVPGIAALSLWRKMDVGYALPAKGDGYDYDQALTTLMAQFYPAGMLGVGLTALMASFMSGMAGNVTAFNTVWTYDIYQSYIRPKAPDCALPAGRPLTTIFGIAAFDRDRVSCAALQQHHGSAAARVRLRQRAAVCDLPAGHVLEARDRPRRVRRDWWRAPAAAADARADRGGRQRRMAGASCSSSRPRWRRISGSPSSPGPRAFW